jgi:dolichol kinase
MTTTMMSTTSIMEWSLWLYMSIQCCYWRHSSASSSSSSASCACSCFWCLFAVAQVAIPQAVVAVLVLVTAAWRRRRRRRNRRRGDNNDGVDSSVQRHDVNSGTTAKTTRPRSHDNCTTTTTKRSQRTLPLPCCIIWRPTTTTQTTTKYDDNDQQQTDRDDGGRLMAQVLVPTLLLAVVVSSRGGGDEEHEQTKSLTSQIEAVSLALTFVFSSSSSLSTSPSSSSSLGSSSSNNNSSSGFWRRHRLGGGGGERVVMMVMMILVTAMTANKSTSFWMPEDSILIRGPSHADALIFFLITAIYHTMTCSSSSITSFLLQPLQGVFTEGEFMVIASLSSFCMVQQDYFYNDYNHYTQKVQDDVADVVGQVSFILILSSVTTCLVVGPLQKATARFVVFHQRRTVLSSNLTTRSILLLIVVFSVSVEALFPSGTGGTVAAGLLSSTSFLPRSLVWLVQFLLETEQGPTTRTLTQQQQHHDMPSPSPYWPRFYWLVYYVVILVIFIPLAPRRQRQEQSHQSQSHSSLSNGKKTTTTTTTTTVVPMSTVVARKWFHLIATLLFTPVTIYAPQLQSLSYAVALSLLILIEAVRVDIPALNHFYSQYLDVSKDNVIVHVVNEDDGEASNNNNNNNNSNTPNHHHHPKRTSGGGGGGGIVVSHMALIVGCAAPLWIANAATATTLSVNHQSSPLYVILSLLGVICLGVGDAVGALVGRYYGRQRSWWGRQGRTLEGSMAMLVSMILFTQALTGVLQGIMKSQTENDSKKSHDNNNNDNHTVTTILPSLIFMTILEAYTTQIDNLILPLAGSTVLLLSLQPQQL